MRHRPPSKPTRGQVQRAIDAFAPPDVTVTLKKTPRRKTHDDPLPDDLGDGIGGTDGKK